MKYGIGIAVVCLSSTLGCSKIEHAIDNADEIKANTIELKQETKEGLRKQKEAGSLVSMDRAIDKLEQAKDVRERQLRAKIFFKSMPFQFIASDQKKTEQFYSNALGYFFTNVFPDLSVVRDEGTEAIRHSIQEDDFNVVAPSRLSSSTVYRYRQLAALAAQMHTIHEDQRKIQAQPKSFYDLCEELIRTSFTFAQCEDCEYEKLPIHLKERLQFASSAIDFFQFAHNVLVFGALGQVFESPSITDYLLYQAGQKEITSNGLIRKSVNANDLYLANQRLERAQKIRELFRSLGIPVHYSKLSYQEKLERLLAFPKGKKRSDSMKNKDEKALYKALIQGLNDTYKEYQETQKGSDQ